MFVPYITESANGHEVRHDLYSRMLQDRIVFLNGPIDDTVANIVIAQLLFLANQDPEKDIFLYINSPGGIITSGMAIFDTMQYVKCDVQTIVIGQAASMGALLACAGAKGKRRILPHSTVLIHQPLGGASGQCSDIQIQASNILRWKTILNKVLSERTGQPLERIVQDTDRDTIFTAEQAVEYGLVDQVIYQK